MNRLMHLRSSSTVYLCILSVGIVAAGWTGYLWYEIPIVWGQSAPIISLFLAFGLSLSAWLILASRQHATGILRAYLALMMIAWAAHLFLYRYHGDSFNYTALLYIPILLMIGLKPPCGKEGWIAIWAFAWSVALVLVLTRLLEILGLLSVKSQPQGIIEFDTELYFLPLNDLLGIVGRWPGPFGHNGDTAMMAAFLVVIAFSKWTRSSWCFLGVGVFTLLITNGRASVGAAAAGLVVMGMFTHSGPLAHVPRFVRIAFGTITIALGALVMFTRPAGLTGRQEIWPAFLQLWQNSPWLGVGGQGIAEGGRVAERYGHAHSLYIDELARWGLLGFATQFVALGLGLYIAARAARNGNAGPLAIMVTYFITAITEPRNNWIAPSATGFLLILSVLVAATSARVGGRETNRALVAEGSSRYKYP